MIRCQLVIAIGDQGALIGQGLCNQLDKARVAANSRGKGVALDIEFNGRQWLDQLRQAAYIVRADMALVRARMHSDTIGAVIDAQLRKLDDIRIVAFSGIADQGDFVEVNAERCHCNRATGKVKLSDGCRLLKSR